jgi:epoxide hydrolase-like predicted phosphatase
MSVRAVVFDVGGVLERSVDPGWLAAKWQRLLGLDEIRFRSALRGVDPDRLIETGGLAEDEYLRRYADALGLTREQAAEWRRDMWDWYCGELDIELTSYLAGLRPRLRTGILSNSADGARREEQARYGFEDLVDTIVYSHEIGVAKPDPRAYTLACQRLSVEPTETVFLDDTEAAVAGARAVGMHAVLHVDTATSITDINALINP